MVVAPPIAAVVPLSPRNSRLPVPFGWTRRKSRSSGRTAELNVSVTVTVVIAPATPLTTTVLFWTTPESGMLKALPLKVWPRASGASSAKAIRAAGRNRRRRLGSEFTMEAFLLGLHRSGPPAFPTPTATNLDGTLLNAIDAFLPSAEISCRALFSSPALAVFFLSVSSQLNFRSGKTQSHPEDFLDAVRIRLEKGRALQRNENRNRLPSPPISCE